MGFGASGSRLPIREVATALLLMAAVTACGTQNPEIVSHPAGQSASERPSVEVSAGWGTSVRAWDLARRRLTNEGCSTICGDYGPEVGDGADPTYVGVSVGLEPALTDLVTSFGMNFGPGTDQRRAISGALAQFPPDAKAIRMVALAPADDGTRCESFLVSSPSLSRALTTRGAGYVRPYVTLTFQNGPGGSATAEVAYADFEWIRDTNISTEWGHASCTPAGTESSPCTTTSVGACIRGGEFCPLADVGAVGVDATGRRYTCSGDPARPHWER